MDNKKPIVSGTIPNTSSSANPRKSNKEIKPLDKGDSTKLKKPAIDSISSSSSNSVLRRNYDGPRIVSHPSIPTVLEGEYTNDQKNALQGVNSHFKVSYGFTNGGCLVLRQEYMECGDHTRGMKDLGPLKIAPNSQCFCGHTLKDHFKNGQVNKVQNCSQCKECKRFEFIPTTPEEIGSLAG